ncbi:nucleolar protein dao-5-like isoform X38 [Macrobrachium rosenbergii]|uniref:nucleolar protein dao-5-like isoform X38 n=1 Tax=Macrobrachium rosenbergii TaxID=79674 RepID=UPI0034D55AE2
MINQFWNLCRACPSVNIDKLHSEYSSTYRWHEYKPQNQNEVIRKPPTAQGETTRPAAGLRSGMGRRRIDWMAPLGGAGSGMRDAGDSDHPVRVSQSEERSRRFLRPSHRSRSEGPLGRDLDDDSLLVSEYKTQYAWVRRGGSARGPEAAPLLEAEKYRAKRPRPETGSKSNNMKSLLTWSNARQPPPQSTQIHVNVNGTAGGGGGGISSSGGHDDDGPAPPAGQQTTPRTPRLEADRIIGGDAMQGLGDDKVSKRAYKSEYRKKFRPFSQYQYVDGKFHKVKTDEPAAGSDASNNWYKEVIELRRQAGQYRARHDIGDVWRTVQHRGWGVETASERLAEIYSKQAELWEQVSRRSSLQALSLAAASPSRPISKAEKDIENSRRSSPIKHVSTSSRERPTTAPPKPKPAAVHTQKTPADKADLRSSKESTPRHHYDRTTGAAEEGLLITSPSRDRIEPIVPEDWSSRRSSRRTPPITSPMKDGPSRRRSNRASSAARPPPPKDCRSSVGGRSISVGPENRSPKRTSRPPSTHAAAPAAKPERRPRPTAEAAAERETAACQVHYIAPHCSFSSFLSTSARRKGTDALPHRTSSHDESKETKKVSKSKPHEPTASPKKGEDRSKADKKSISEETDLKKEKDKEIIPKDKDGTAKEPVEAMKESSGRKSTPEPRFDPEKYEPVVKTPPEPTRVKSPDQVGKWAMVKSPDPVNWTVPLDTGKTFTVTHNIPEATHCLRIPRGESARGTPSSEHRQGLESRTRQTPEPTKLTQGPLVGTPLSAISSDAKSYSQEQPKLPTATTVDPKVDDKPVEKKTDSSKPADIKAAEPKVPESKAPEAKPLDIKASEPKLETKVPGSKPIDSKVEPKPSETKVPEVKPFDTKVEPKVAEVPEPESKPLDTKVDPKLSETKVPEVKPKVDTDISESKPSEVKPFDTKSDPKASETKTDAQLSDTKIEPSLKESSTQELKPSEFMTKEPKLDDFDASDSKLAESKAPQPKLPESSFDKDSDPASDLKSSQSPQPHQPIQQVPPKPPAPSQSSPVDILPPSSGAVDPMSMSMFGSLNGMNGKSSGTPSPTKPEVPLPSSEPSKESTGPESKPGAVRSIPGTNLRCLDDPSFMFDQPSQATTNSPKAGGYKVLEAPTTEASQQKPGAFRVLEAPEAPSDIKDLPDQSPSKPEAPVKPSPYRVLEAPLEPTARPKGSPYRVLEAPDAPFYPQAQTVGAPQESKPPSLVSPSSGRAVTDALDKARSRFDSFWGGPKDKDPPSQV